jgi:hypothetical protein
MSNGRPSLLRDARLYLVLLILGLLALAVPLHLVAVELDMGVRLRALSDQTASSGVWQYLPDAVTSRVRAWAEATATDLSARLWLVRLARNLAVGLAGLGLLGLGASWSVARQARRAPRADEGPVA